MDYADSKSASVGKPAFPCEECGVMTKDLYRHSKKSVCPICRDDLEAAMWNRIEAIDVVYRKALRRHYVKGKYTSNNID